jgi:hypothetical protein
MHASGDQYSRYCVQTDASPSSFLRRKWATPGACPSQSSEHLHLDKLPRKYGLRSAWAGDISGNALHFEGQRWWYPVGLLLLSPDLQRNAVAHGTARSSHLRPRFLQPALLWQLQPHTTISSPPTWNGRHGCFTSNTQYTTTAWTVRDYSGQAGPPSPVFSAVACGQALPLGHQQKRLLRTQRRVKDIASPHPPPSRIYNTTRRKHPEPLLAFVLA